MKRQNLLVIILVAFVSAVLSIALSGILFGSPKRNPILVPQVDKISSSFPSPNTDQNYTKFFNSNALDPTQLIQIGGNNNTTPFQGGTSQ